MPSLHYGPVLQLPLDDAATKHAAEDIGAHATRGGWVTITDSNGRHWSLLISPGIPVWISDDD